MNDIESVHTSNIIQTRKVRHCKLKIQKYSEHLVTKKKARRWFALKHAATDVFIIYFEKADMCIILIT